MEGGGVFTRRTAYSNKWELTVYALQYNNHFLSNYILLVSACALEGLTQDKQVPMRMSLKIFEESRHVLGYLSAF